MGHFEALAEGLEDRRLGDVGNSPGWGVGVGRCISAIHGNDTPTALASLTALRTGLQDQLSCHATLVKYAHLIFFAQPVDFIVFR